MRATAVSLATISPNGDGYRDAAAIRFRLAERDGPPREVARTVSEPVPVYELTATLPAGRHELRWAPGPRGRAAHPISSGSRSGTWLTTGAPTGPLTRGRAASRRRRSYASSAWTRASPRDSYAPGQWADLIVSRTRARSTCSSSRAGVERMATTADNVMNGVPIGEALTIPWDTWRNKPHRIRIGIGPWDSGLYFLRLTADDGRVGYAPFVVRPALLGAASRVAVVLPTNTWQAYNFRDEDGNGWGTPGTRRAPRARSGSAGRAARRGVPPQFRKYDLAFLHWLAWTGKKVDTLAESDLELIGPATSSPALRPRRLPRPHGVRDPARVRRDRDASAIWAETSSSSRRTTSSGRCGASRASCGARGCGVRAAARKRR